MKITIHQDLEIKENQIIINCSMVDKRMQNLIDYIRQYSFSLRGIQKNEIYQVPIENILFVDSVDGKTFLYDRENIYESKESLMALEKVVVNTPFVRISKSCILNSTYLKSVRSLVNHRMEATLTNGEKLIITRNYIEDVKIKLKNW
jgi:DNA-binding LytR/AlgR family response regulator